jgi:CheY-like chemotaxis protein
LFSDVVMPGPPAALALAAEAKRLVGDQLKVVFTSGYTENSISHNGQLDPGVLLISKPWRLDQLARFLRSAIDARPLEPPKQRVLLVEDQPLVSMTTSELLSAMGFEVTVAESGEEALRKLEQDFDVLITDLGLPDMDGTALIAAARTKRAKLAVVVASGRSSSVSELAGSAVWLPKPYGTEDMRQAISQATKVVG